MSYFKSLNPIENSNNFGPYILDQMTFARDNLAADGLPTRKSEDWKYTNLRVVENADFSLFKSSDQHSKIVPQDEAHLTLTDSGLQSHDPSLKIYDWANFPGIHSVETYIQRHDKHSTFLNQLNSAALSSVSLLKITEQSKLNLLDLSNSSGSPKSHFILIEVEKNTNLDICFEAASQTASMKNLRMFFLLREGSKVNMDRFYTCASETLVFSKLDVHLTGESSFHAFDYVGGTQLIRNEILVKISGENANADISCLYFGEKDQHIDNHVSVLHEAPNSSSSQVYRGILKDQARAVFNGKVKVARAAQKTNASQLNKTLMLSSEAEIDAKPQLEIDADDVKCGHGAAIAQINQDELFYLISRGIPRERSRAMLIRAFANEIVGHCHSAPMSEKLTSYLSQRDFS